jgi:hypothetical protein
MESGAGRGATTEGAVQSLTSIVKGLGALVFLTLRTAAFAATGLRRGLHELGDNLAAAVAPCEIPIQAPLCDRVRPGAAGRGVALRRHWPLPSSRERWGSSGGCAVGD